MFQQVLILLLKIGVFMEDRFKTFTMLVSKVSRYIRKIKTEEVSEMGLKSPHVSCLYYLYKQEGLTSKDLSSMCEEDKGAISRSLEYLENNKLIYCKSSQEKRYKSPFYLTDKGKRIGTKLANKIDNILNITSEGLTEENRAIFYKSFALIVDNLEKICEKYGE